MADRLEFEAEIREDLDRQSPGRIVGTMLTTGRVAGDRPEVFAPGGVTWPSGGVALLMEHRGREVMRFTPEVRGAEVRIDAPLPDTALGRALADEIRSGKRRGMSVEFHALRETRTQGVREIERALVDGVIATDNPSYSQTRVEVRDRRRRVWL